MPTTTRYGLTISQQTEEINLLLIEMEAIRRGGHWVKDGIPAGEGLTAHYKNACRMIWPHIDWHRWMEVGNNEIRRPGAKVTVLLGPGSSGKTAVSGWEYLLEYYCLPDDTLVLISSTDMRGLELRVWGEIKKLHDMAKERFPWLPGYLIDSKHCITTDELGDEQADEQIKTRDLRKGVMGIPTVQGGRSVGLGRWQGIKQKHIRLIADDCAAMSSVFLSAFSNLNNNDDFQAIVVGNPDDILDPLGTAAEPIDGWGGHYEPEKTEVWDTKFYNGRCVNFVGTDSPNFDDPNNPERYRYLVSPRKINETERAFGKDSFEYYSQCVGVMKISQMSRRVLTRDLVKQFHAQDDCVWDGEPMRIGALDAAYGGDRAIAGYIEFGKCVDGKIRIHSSTPEIVPVKVKTDAPMDAEGQIAVWVKQYFDANGVAPENFFHDSTGRGSLGTALARVWSALCNPVEFGGSSTSRIVSADLFWTDPKTNQRRLKLCNEHYSKFVTELWFAVRYGIEADQIRGMMSDVVDEFCMRQWTRVKDDKLEVESKIEMKTRTRKSPDLADWFCWIPSTLILTPSGEVPIGELKVGDSVTTPFGVTRIAMIYESASEKVSTVEFSDGKALTGRNQHGVFTWDKGWVNLSNLSIDNEIESAHDLWIWDILNQLFTRVEHSSFKQLAAITKTATRLRRRDFYTGPSGRIGGVLSQGVFAFIIKTMIGLTIESKTLNWLRSRRIARTTCGGTGKILKCVESICHRFLNGWRVAPNGTSQNQDRHGTPRTQRITGRTTFLSKGACASVAEKDSPRAAFKNAPSFVPIHAGKRLPEGDTKTIPASAVFAALVLLLTSILKPKLVPLRVVACSPIRKERLLNLTLERHNVYYANGVLVENCICVEGARRRGFIISKLGGISTGTRKPDWLDKQTKDFQNLLKARQLQEA